MAKKKPNTWKWLFSLVAIVAVGFFAYSHYSTPGKPQAPLPSQYKGEEEGDYRGRSAQLHKLVDQALLETKVKVEKKNTEEKKQQRSNGKGQILWQARNIILDVPASMTMQQFATEIKKQVKNQGDILFLGEDKSLDRIATRIDVGFRGSLGGEELSIVTDRIYLFPEKEAGDKNEKKDKQEKEPATKKSIPPAPGGGGQGKLAIVIDDFGYSDDVIEDYAAIKRPLTFAIIPYHPYSREAAKAGVASGHEVILHLPMEPMDASETSEKITVMTNMSEEEIRSIVVNALAQVPEAVGINNHQGSRATSDARTMQAVVSVLKNKNLFLLDSRTSGSSVAAATARSMGVPAAANELFIDNSNDVDSIKQRLRQAGQMALRDGTAIVIGHARPRTVAAIQAMIPELEAEGVSLIFVSQLTHT